MTKEERDILLLSAQTPGGKHLDNREIGQRLGLPVGRVKALLHQVCVKLQAQNRIEAIMQAMRRGEISTLDVLSPDDLAEILSPLGPGTLRQMATLLRAPEPNPLLEHEQRVLPNTRRADGRLTNRERDVLALGARGLSNQDIADRLCMSLSAVKTFFRRASAKLGVHRRSDAWLLALRLGEIGLSDTSSFDEVLRHLAPLGPGYLEQLAARLDAEAGRPPPPPAP